MNPEKDEHKSKTKRKAKQWKICHPEFCKIQPRGEPIAILSRKKMSKLLYTSLDTRGRKLMKIRNIRFTQRHYKSSFEMFKKICMNARSCCKAYNKGELDIFKKLDFVITDDYFGTRKHRKLFYACVKKILSRSAFECMYAKCLIKGYDLKNVPWLNKFHDKEIIWKKRFLYLGNVWLLENIVKPIINHCYYSLNAGMTHEIQYIPIHLWRSYEDRAINMLKNMDYIIKDVPPNMVYVRGALQIKPKNGLHNFNFRVIMKLIKKRRMIQKPYLHIIYTRARQISKTEVGSLYNSWKNYIKRVGDKNIYAVKLDVSDAFGNVNITSLVNSILETKWKSNVKEFLKNYLNNQYVTLKSRVSKSDAAIYKWNHGLLQGDQLSSAFCELYMSHMDNKHLTSFYKPNCLVHRTVDDYLFCSTDPEDIRCFIKIMSLAHVLNNNKTQSNVKPYSDVEIEYCGRIINMNTREMKGLYKYHNNVALRYRFKLWNKDVPLEQEGFLTRAMHFPYNNYHFSKEELNTFFNSENVVLENIFCAMIFLAFKFDAAVMAIYDSERMQLYGRMLANTIWNYSKRILIKIKKFSGNKYEGNINFKTLIKISYSAFTLVLNKRSLKYKELIKAMKKKQKMIFVKNFDLKRFGKLPKCFDPIKMNRVVNIVT